MIDILCILENTVINKENQLKFVFYQTSERLKGIESLNKQRMNK